MYRYSGVCDAERVVKKSGFSTNFDSTHFLLFSKITSYDFFIA